MTLALILVVTIVVGVVGYYLVTRSKTAAPIPQGERASVAVVQAPGDVKATIDNAALKGAQSAALRSLSQATSSARLSLVTGG
jgi:hypothetical protein